MKRLGYFVCIAVCCVCLCMVGCSEKSDIEIQDYVPPEGLKYKVDGVPKVEEFSDSAYEDYQDHFLPVSAAVYHHDGVKEEISSHDPRLIRLLNFLAYSEEIQVSSIRQGYVEDDEIHDYLTNDAPMLEINFDYDGTSTSLLSTYKVLICGSTYLTFIDTQKPSWVLGDGDFAKQRYPYDKLLCEQVMSGALPEDVLYEKTWGDNNWLDILTYCGF